MTGHDARPGRGQAGSPLNAREATDAVEGPGLRPGGDGVIAGIAAAYDAIAADYDRQVQGDAWMRRVLWQRYGDVFRPGEHILDVSCGTGTDAIFLARSGMRVTGVDASPAMIAQLRSKVVAAGLADQVEAWVMDAARLSELPAASFDGIISAFAGLNTISDLSAFAADAARVLRPGGRMILHLLNRFSLWEWLGLLGSGRRRELLHLGRDRERTFTIGGHPLCHYLYSPDEAFEQFFAPEFHLRRQYALGCLRPPPTVTIPRPVSSILGKIEAVGGARRPLVNWGRFFVLELEKRERPG